jgi:hypothetical protein
MSLIHFYLCCWCCCLYGASFDVVDANAYVDANVTCSQAEAPLIKKLELPSLWPSL